jgi:aminoglycoside 6'-N-acetyltransferase
VLETTWDGLPIAPDDPRGATVVVRRDDGHVLLLHRAHHGPDFHGDWAWTAPAGARQPGEPILPAALRELAEETGLTDLPVAPVDLSAHWAHFVTEAPTGTAIDLVDAEHDRYEWVPAAEAIARLRPTGVGVAMRRALGVPTPAVAFRPLVRNDFAALVRWQTTAPIRDWWTHPVSDPTAAEAKYGPRIDGASATAVDVILIDEQPVGFIQITPVPASQEYLMVAAPVTDGGIEAVSIDYGIGDPALVGRGIGTQAIWRYVQDVAFQRFPNTRYVVADPITANRASIRACEKAGFQSLAEFTPPSGIPHTLCVLDRARVFGGHRS